MDHHDETPRSTPPNPYAGAGKLRAMLRWFQRLAETRWAVPMVFLLTFADACVSPILPEVLLIPMVLAAPKKAWRYAMVCSIASALGGLFGYWLGFVFWEQGLREFCYEWLPGCNPASFETVSTAYGNSTFWVVFMAGFTPVPYKLFTLVAGVCHDNVELTPFITASVISRTLRFYLEVWLMKRYGPRAVNAMLKHSRWIATVLMVALVALVLWLVWDEIGFGGAATPEDVPPKSVPGAPK